MAWVEKDLKDDLVSPCPAMGSVKLDHL